MWWLHASEICVIIRLEGLYIIEKQWKPYTSKNLTLGGETPEYGPKKRRLGPQNGSRSLGLENCQK